MKIVNIEATVHAIASHIPLLTEKVEGYGQVKPRPFVVCRVETDNGLVGYGFTGRFKAEQVADTLNNAFLSLLENLDFGVPDDFGSELTQLLNPEGVMGVIAHAQSALDIALWDIAGQAADKSIAQLIGGKRSRAPAYVTFGMPQYDRDQLVEAARFAVKQGHKVLKMVVAVDPGGWQEDARRIKAVRQALSDDIGLMIDANEMFSLEEAIQLAQSIADYRVDWFEEPVGKNDIYSLLQFKETTGMAVAAGQFEGDQSRFLDFIESRAVDVLQPNACYCGGFSGAIKIAEMAAKYDLDIANGAGWPAINLHLMAGVQNSSYVEHHIAQVGMAEAIFLNPPEPVDGYFTVPDAPGLGLKINLDGLRECRIT